MSEGASKRCTVAYATRERQYLWEVELPAEASVAQALEAARQLAGPLAIPWESAPTGIFGEPCRREDVPRAGDRIELYRPLEHDPKQARRERVRRERRGAR
jgi:putative ubiquitin-RnfH superfamily antitoxin RatB of RatAB toxin-antitoxin module